MKLSDHPDLGKWRICANITDNKKSHLQTTNFQVKEYVLPKFEVKMTAPPVLRNSENFTVTVCAMYTYGKAVVGDLTLFARVKSWGYWDRERYPEKAYQTKISKCVNVTIFAKDLGWKNSSYSSREVELTPRVTEDGTGVERNSTTKVNFKTSPFTMDSDCPSYFRPNMPTKCKISLKNHDGSPRSKEDVQCCCMPTYETVTPDTYDLKSEIFCKNFTSDNNGVVNVALPAVNTNCVQMNLQVDALNHPKKFFEGSDYEVLSYQPSTGVQMKSWFSNSKRYLQCVKPSEPIPSNSKYTITIYLNGKEGDEIPLHYQIMSPSGIVSEGSATFQYSEVKGKIAADESYLGRPSDADQQLGIVSWPIDISDAMSPESYLTVFYNYEGELIADSMQLKIAPSLKNQPDMTFSSRQVEPGEFVDLKLTASPHSVCSISAVDESVKLLGADKEITLEKLYKIPRDYAETRFSGSYTSGSCVPQKEPSSDRFIRRKRSLVPPHKMYKDFQDASDAFRNGKVSCLSDLNMVTKPCTSSYSYYRSRPYDDDDDVEEDEVTGGSEYYYNANEESSEYSKPGGSPRFHMKMMKSAPRAMMAMDSANFEPNGGRVPTEDKVRTEFPETWLWELCNIDENGLFTKQAKMPDTITTWNAKALCLNSEDGLGISPVASVTGYQPFFVSNSMPASGVRGEVIPVTLSIYNYCNQSLPIVASLQESRDFTLMNGVPEAKMCVKPGTSETHKFLIMAQHINKVDITTHASSVPNSDICQDNDVSTITTKDAATNPLLIVAEGVPKVQTMSTLMCGATSSDSYETTMIITSPEGCIEDTLRTQFRLSGDIMGPSVQNMGNLIQMPTGCGEQTMFKMITDVCVLNFLNNTGNLDEDTKNKAIEFLKTGYQRQLSYAHKDGSFSSFGSYDSSGSVFLTAMVIKGLEMVSKFIEVDKNVIKRGKTWLGTEQNDDDGCYPFTGEVHHYAMRASRATLTSYVAAALSDSASADDDTSMKDAMKCIAKSNTSDVYSLALKAYAMVINKHPDADKYVQDLMQHRKSEGDYDYFHWDGCDPDYGQCAIGTEITGYAVLCLLSKKTPDTTAALPMIRYLTSKCNSQGGYYSTQDTLVVLQALAKFSELHDHRPVNSDITVTGEGVEKMAFHVDKSNKLLLQTADLTKNNVTLSVKSVGSGCPVVQVAQFCNVRTPIAVEKFHLNVTALKGVERNCNKTEVTTCFSYKSTKRPSNMALVEMQIPTGYSVDEDSLEKLKFDPTLYFRRSEMKAPGKTMVLYFKEVHPKKKCFNVGFQRDFEVQNLKPCTAVLYDYYQNENKVSQQFEIPEKCEL